jgi:hypothetical protein
LEEVEMDGGLDDISTHPRAATGTAMTLRVEGRGLVRG